MAGAVVDLVVEKLASVLTNEVNLFRGAHEEVRYIKDELDTIRLFLTNAEPKMGTGGEEEDGNFKAWVNQVRDLAFCIEDIIDNWTLYMAQRRDHHGLLGDHFRLPKKLKDRRDIVHEIQEIKKRVDEVRNRYDRYNRSSYASLGTAGASGSAARGGSSYLYDPRMASLFVAEAELVGIQGPKEDLISRLVDGNVVSKNKVISVVGIGGLGKTTLVKRVFDDPRVAAYCDCHAWITVSQSYKKDELLRDLIKQLHGTAREDPPAALVRIDTLGEVSLISKLREYLTEKRYVVVFDDVWKIDLWDYIKLALPENGKGSRIMFTTRNENVIPSSKESPFHHVYKLETLPRDNAFELFCKKAFHFDEGSCPPHLIELSHEIVDRCGGLPLAIVTIGCLLATKNRDASEWQTLNDGLSSILASNQQLADDQQLAKIERVLSLSYHDLPYHLKICFLYLGMFPEDYVINCNKIMQLWMAQGFIKGRKGVALEDVAKEYLTELLHRSLVQVEGVRAGGRVKEFGVHDLMREIVILPRVEELGLHRVLGDRDTNINGRCRHLAIQDWTNNVAEHLNNSEARSMILFGKGEDLGLNFSVFLDNSKILTALDLENSPLDYIPEELGNLWHLRYLSLRKTKVKALPNSIGRLCNLETLDLRMSLVYDIPVEINRLLKLQYLLAYSYNEVSEIGRGVKIHDGIGCLNALQKLYQIEVDKGPLLICELGRLIQLQKLGIRKLRTFDGSILCSVLEKMTRLRSLLITAENSKSLELESMIVPPPVLQVLSFGGPLRKLPHWIPKVKNLMKIELCGSRLGGEEDPLQVLQALPNLEDLRITRGYEKESLHFSKGCFAKMKKLLLQVLDGLKRLVIEEGALPLLRELDLGPCPQLEELPDFHFLGNLNTLTLELQRHFVFELLPDSGHHYGKIKHVPRVAFDFKIRGIGYKHYRVGDPGLVKLLNESSS